MRRVEKIIKNANRTWRNKNIKMAFRPLTGIKLCFGVTAVFGLIYLLIHCFCAHDSFVYSFMFALFTGVVASSLVTIAVEMNNNNQRNKKRWVKLNDYFRYIVYYQSGIQTSVEALKEIEAEYKIATAEYEEPRLAAWRRIIQDARQSSDEGTFVLTKNEYEYVAIAQQIAKGVSIFETVYTQYYELFSNSELETICYIISDIELMKREIRSLIRYDIDIDKFYETVNRKGDLEFIEAERRYEAAIDERLNSIFPEILSHPDLLETYGQLFHGIAFAKHLENCDIKMKELEKYIYDEPGYGDLLKIGKIEG